MGNLTAQISGTTYTVKEKSIKLDDKADNRSVVKFVVQDQNGALSFQRGQPILLADSVYGPLFAGFVQEDKPKRLSADPNTPYIEHMISGMDNHYRVDKRSSSVPLNGVPVGLNYTNWLSGDIICDFIQRMLGAEGVTGQYAGEFDYSQAAFAAGTLTNASAISLPPQVPPPPTNPAPGTPVLPTTTSTGALTLTKAGTDLIVAEGVTPTLPPATTLTQGNFSAGTLSNMQVVGGTLVPTTQSALRVVAQFPVAGLASVAATANYDAQHGVWYRYADVINNKASLTIWTGSQAVGSNNTLNYDLWIASTSPDFKAGVDLVFNDGTKLSDNTYSVDNQGSSGLFDSLGLSVDLLTDLTQYTKDMWYSRSISLASLSGKTISSVVVYLTGSNPGTYTIYVKNIYLSNGPTTFFATNATAPVTNPPTVSCVGGFASSSVITSVLPAMNPLTSSRISPSYSLASVGLMQKTTIAWQATLPSTGTAQLTYPLGVSPPSSAQNTGSPDTLLVWISYDGTTWLACTNQQALPGLPPGSNVAATTFYLQERFACGSDPTALPALLQITVRLFSAANASTSQVIAAYGTGTQWNSGTELATTPTSGGQLSLSNAQLLRDWNDNLITNQTFFANSGSQSVAGGAYTITNGLPAMTGGIYYLWSESQCTFLPVVADGTYEADISVVCPTATGTWSWAAEGGIVYRTSAWGITGPPQLPTTPATYAYLACLQLSSSNGSNSASVVLYRGANNTQSIDRFAIGSGSVTATSGTSYHLKVVVQANRHLVYFNNSSTPIIDIVDQTYTGPGGAGLYQDSWGDLLSGGPSPATTFSATFDNFKLTGNIPTGTWTSPSLALSSLGTCGQTQIAWSEINASGVASTTVVALVSIDGGNTWKQAANGSNIPGLSVGTNVSAISLQVRLLLFAKDILSIPTVYGLFIRVCQSYGTVTGTRISPGVLLTPAGRVGTSIAMWYGNIQQNTSIAVAVAQSATGPWTDISANNNAALPYWYAQPAPQIDLFTANTSASYTNTTITGGSASTVTYDTANSRITMSGGTGGLYLWSGISRADIDMLADLDESDAGGLVWRHVDNSNYYELGVYDDHSTSGFTNTMRLYKVASGTRSLLGSASITWPRSTPLTSPYRRFRVTMMAGVITCYCDGLSLITYTDGSPLGAGTMGIRNDGGMSRYYQLRLQPLGDSVVGVTLYSKVTLTTTDPAYNPQLFSLVINVRNVSIADGAKIPQLHPITRPFAVRLDKEIDGLVAASGSHYWLVDINSQLWFQERHASPAPFVLSSYDLLYAPTVAPNRSADLYRNRQQITDAIGLLPNQVEYKPADGTTTSWNMMYPLYSAPTISVIPSPGATPIPKTVGLQGINTGYDFYWQWGSTSISQDTLAVPIVAPGEIVVAYTGQFYETIMAENTAEQTARAAIETGTTGIIEEIETAQRQLLTQSMTADAATTWAQGLLSLLANNTTVEFTGTIARYGLLPGMLVPVFCPEHGLWNIQLPVIKVSIDMFTKADSSLYYRFAVTASNGPNLSNAGQVWGM